MERLTSYQNELDREMICRYEECDTVEEYCPYLNEANCSCLQEVLNKLAEYEDLEEQGLLLKLPCKVGTTVYSVARDCGGDTLDCRCMDCEDCRYLYTYVEENAFDTWMCDEIGKSIFLTEQEAQSELEKMKVGGVDG